MMSTRQSGSDALSLPSAAFRTCSIEISKIRTDAGTQHRSGINASIVAEYAQLMEQAIAFPPVRVWSDGSEYWLTDGFHRVAAAERLRRTTITAEIRHGTLTDAIWDSYAANREHGLRRRPQDLFNIIRRALSHPNARYTSNTELARHIGVSEPTLRRWRKRLLSPSSDDDGIRFVTRGASTYALHTQDIGKRNQAARSKSLRQLRADLDAMKADASPEARRLLTILGNWAVGPAGHTDCLCAIERAIKDWTGEPRLISAGNSSN